MMHQDTGYDGPDRRSISADMTLLALKFDTIHADVTEIKGAIREMTTAVNASTTMNFTRLSSRCMAES